MKIFAALLVLLGTSMAFADDSAVAYIDVQGIQPAGNANTVDNWQAKRVDVYGNEVKNLFYAMPKNTAMPDDYRSLSFYSKSYIADVSCQKEYVRPTTGETRQDYQCTFSVVKNPYAPGVYSEEGDFFNIASEPEYGISALADKSIDALGIAPVGVTPGTVYTFYGKQSEYLAKNLVGGGITVSSKSYSVSWTCKQTYVSPSTGKTMNDYMCSLALATK